MRSGPSEGGRNPVGVALGARPNTQRSSFLATLGWRPKPRWGFRNRAHARQNRVVYAAAASALLLVVVLPTTPTRGAQFETLFQQATNAYRAGDYANAAAAFGQSAALKPACGTLQNLGNAEWRAGQAGPAILAWERSLWLDPFNRAAHNNLRFARKALQVESPELGWFEVISTWLPVSWWAWIAGLSFWVAVAAALMPGILRWRKAGWHQAIAALALTIFLLSLPAHAGVQTRARIGFVLQKDTSLRLTPTADAQDITRLAAGDPARLVRVRGDYLLVRTSRATGWLRKGEFGQLCP